jgi:hypothetical protein
MDTADDGCDCIFHWQTHVTSEIPQAEADRISPQHAGGVDAVHVPFAARTRFVRQPLACRQSAASVADLGKAGCAILLQRAQSFIDAKGGQTNDMLTANENIC